MIHQLAITTSVAMTKLPTKMAPALSFGATLPPPRLCLRLGRGGEGGGLGLVEGGVMQSWWGRVGGGGGGGVECLWGGGGLATLCGKKSKKRPPHNTDRHVDSKHKHSKTNGSRLPL